MDLPRLFLARPLGKKEGKFELFPLCLFPDELRGDSQSPEQTIMVSLVLRISAQEYVNVT